MSINSIIDADFIERFKSDQGIQDLKKIIQKRSSNNKGQVRIKSVMNPTAQIAELCSSCSWTDLTFSPGSLLDNVNSGLTSFDRAVLELQFLYGLRVSEVLGIKPEDISENGSIKINGLKGSSNRSVYAVRCVDFWQSMRLTKWCIPSSYNRYYFYRLYKKKGLSQVFGSNVKASVTHSLRYAYLISLLESKMEINEIQRIIGHKSINSTLHYVENLKR